MIDKTKYVVLDVETNGTSSVKHDLLSISLYKPDDNKLYNRFLPLELNEYVETYWINGISEEMLSDKEPINQEEFDNILVEYELEKRIILTYGNLDEKFIKKYLQRHKITGFEKLHFYNFKHNIISSSFSEGNITKDNLCQLYNIKGIKETHSSSNDCILEWELFEKMDNKKLFVIDNIVYELSNDYIIPASYLQNYYNFKYHLPNIKKINYDLEEVFSKEIHIDYSSRLNHIAFGRAIEHLLNTMLNAENKEKEAIQFLSNNKSKLKEIGELPYKEVVIPLNFYNDGQVSARRKEHEIEINNINNSIQHIKNEFVPVVDFINCYIFNNKTIISQEIVINKSDNILAKCDLSSTDAVLEIKTGHQKIKNMNYQLYYESNNRDIYILDLHFLDYYNNISVIIYKVIFNTIEKSSRDRNKLKNFEKKLNNSDLQVLEYNGYKNDIKLKCRKCGNIWTSKYTYILNHKNCPICNPIQIKTIVSKSNTNKNSINRQISKTKEERLLERSNKYKSKIMEKSNDTIEVLNYISSKENVTVRCKICGFEWSGRSDHIIERCYCKKCNKNKK